MPRPTTARASRCSRARPSTPSASIAWDATHDGRTALRASFNHYVDTEVIAVAPHTLGSQVQRRCQYNATTDDYDTNCTYSGGFGGQTVGLPCSPTGVDNQGRPCRSKLVLPKTWEYTLGAEREVLEGLSLGIDGIYRKFTNQFETTETNRIWNQAGTALEPTGQFRNGRAQTVSNLETPYGAGRRYIGVTGDVTRREGKFKMQGSYTWSRLDGTVMEGSGNLYGDRPARDLYLNGPLADDHRHEVKANLSYAATRWLSTTVRYSYYSGLPYSQRYRNTVTGSYDDYRAQVGYTPGGNLNDRVRRPQPAPARHPEPEHPGRLQLPAADRAPAGGLRGPVERAGPADRERGQRGRQPPVPDRPLLRGAAAHAPRHALQVLGGGRCHNVRVPPAMAGGA